jgi:hypothetical protein
LLEKVQYFVHLKKISIVYFEQLKPQHEIFYAVNLQFGFTKSNFREGKDEAEQGALFTFMSMPKFDMTVALTAKSVAIIKHNVITENNNTAPACEEKTVIHDMSRKVPV